MHPTRKVGYGRIADVTGPPDRALNGPGGCQLAALHQVGNYLRYTGRDASSFGKAARDPKPTHLLPRKQATIGILRRGFRVLARNLQQLM